MIPKNVCLLLLTSLLLSATLYGQSDYLITVRGDTLKGTISFQHVGVVDQVLIKRTKREILQPTGVREVLLKGVRYKPVQFSSSIKFMQVLTDGDRKSTRLNSSHSAKSRMPSSA